MSTEPNVAGAPGAVVGTLTPPGSYSSTLTPTTFTASGITLQANSTYWVVLSSAAAGDEFGWSSTSDPAGTGVGFSTAWRETTDSGVSWPNGGNTEPYQMKVEAIPGSVVLSNIGETYNGFYTIESPYMTALGFSTGPGAYQINRLSLSLLAGDAANDPGVSFSVRLYAAGADNLPTGDPLAQDDNLTATWTPPFAIGYDQRTFNYGPAQLPNLSAYNLSPNTKYALGVITTSGNFNFGWAMGSSAYTTSEGFAFTTGSFFDSSWSAITDKPIAAISVAPAASAPGAPTGLSATPGDGQASIAFTAPASNGGAAITNYEYSIN